MGKLKGYSHHVAKGAADAVVTVTEVIAVAGIGVAAGAFAGIGVAAATESYKDRVPEGAQRTCRRIGAGLLAAFTIACGGAGYAVSQEIGETNDHAASTSSTNLRRYFSVQVSGNDNEDCILVVPANGGPVRTESASCSVKELGLSRQ